MSDIRKNPNLQDQGSQTSNMKKALLTQQNKAFTSLSALKQRHSELLKLHRKRGDNPEVLSDIEELVLRGSATGTVLNLEGEREAAQGILDYWSSMLYRSGQVSPDATLYDFSITTQKVGKFNFAIEKQSDFRLGDRYYNYGPTADDIRAIVQESILANSLEAQHGNSSPDENSLPILFFKTQVAEHINIRLAALEELNKLGQLPEQCQADFNQLKAKVFAIMRMQEELTELSTKADNILKTAVDTLTDKLKSLENSQANSMLEARSSAIFQEQIKLIEEFQKSLNDGKIVAHWLSREQADGLAAKLGQYALDNFPPVQNKVSTRQMEAFYFTLDQFLENLCHCLTWGRRNSLEKPVTPIVIEDEVYIISFLYLKENMPDFLPFNGIAQLKEYIDYLMQQLPNYQHLSIEENKLEDSKDEDSHQTLDQYLERTLNRLKRQGCLDIQQGVTSGSQHFNYVARISDFGLPFGPLSTRGEAVFLFSEFTSITIPILQQFSGECLQWAREQVNPKATGQAFYNFRAPTHLCFAIALVDQLDAETKAAIQATNPIDRRADILWYEVPVVYGLNDRQLYFYSKPANFFDHFKGEIAWKQIRPVIQQLLSPVPDQP